MAKRNVLIITADLFEDAELLSTVDALRKAGHNVDVAAPEKGPIMGKKGARVEADKSIDDVEVPLEGTYDMLLLPGGKAPQALRGMDRVKELVRYFDDQGKPIAAICHGPQILISAGIMKGRTATSYSSVQAELKEAGVETRDEEVVVDGNLITSRQPGDIPAFNQAMLERL
jgi:protease I